MFFQQFSSSDTKEPVSLPLAYTTTGLRLFDGDFSHLQCHAKQSGSCRARELGYDRNCLPQTVILGMLLTRGDLSLFF